MHEPHCSSLLLCGSEQLLSRRQPIGGPLVLDLLYFFTQPELVEVLIQEQEPIALFAWGGSSVANPVQQFAGNSLDLRMTIRFLLAEHMPNGHEQFSSHGDNRLLPPNARGQTLKLG